MRIFAAFLLLAAAPLRAATIDRIAALVDRQVLTVSEISQMVEIRFFPRTTGWSEDDYRKNILDSLIAQALRFRDVERFGAEDVSKDSIEARLLQIQQRFASPTEFSAALLRAELTLDEVRALIKRQLQVETYIQERFAPMIFVSTDEIENYYRTTWSEQRRARGLPIPPLAEVQDEIRTLLKSTRLQHEVERWTTQLRARANVDIYAWK
jgi:peptidyl-prolyl cis-trans isomerase SurA